MGVVRFAVRSVAAAAAAEDTSTSMHVYPRSDALTGLPSCAVPCLPKCNLTDVACVCADGRGTGDALGKCLLAACELPQAMFSRNATEAVCQTPVRDKGPEFNATIITLGVTATIVMILRLLYKRHWSARRRMEREDWSVLLIGPVGIPTLALSVAGLTGHGLGRDIWAVGQSDLIAFGKYFYVMMLLYVALIFMTKLSLTLFYLNIFAGVGIQRVLWATVAFHVAACLTYMLVLIFQCSPISYEWEKYDFTQQPFPEATCINLNVGAWSQAAINVAADIWLLAIPIWQVRKLALSWKKKVGVLLMFMTGAVVTIVSILRLSSIVRFAKTTNPTYDQWNIVFWSGIEICVGLICICLPAMRLILVKITPRVFGTSAQSQHARLESPSRTTGRQVPSATYKVELECMSREPAESKEAVTEIRQEDTSWPLK